MGGIPNPSITSLWNKTNIIIETGWSEEQYYQASRRTTRAIMIILEARMRKERQARSANG